MLRRKLFNRQHASSFHRSSRPIVRENFFCYDDLSKDDKKFQYFTGLTVKQFVLLLDFLGPVANKLNYYCDSNRAEKSPCKKRGPQRLLCPRDQLCLTLVRFRRAYTLQELAYFFRISNSSVCIIFKTWVHFLYKRFNSLRQRMFPERHEYKKLYPTPKCFQPFKNLRVIVDCTEIFTQMPSDFRKQGNMYSSYKNHHTLKFLVGIGPSGAIVYTSEAFEGAISDVDLFKSCGIADYLKPGDLVLADRGFTLREFLQERQVMLNIPPFLQGRDRLTPQEEIETKRIARARIHVERANERLKKFCILRNTVPSNLSSLISKIFFILACLVNFQPPLVK